MNTYKIYEFVSLLCLGLWAGGRIPELGVLSAPHATEGDASLAGLRGLWLGSGITLEKDHPGAGNETILTFSVYDPYENRHRFYEVTATLTEDTDVYDSLQTLMEQSGQLYTQGSSNRYISFQQKRRYYAIHSSMWGGTIATPGRK